MARRLAVRFPQKRKNSIIFRGFAGEKYPKEGASARVRAPLFEPTKRQTPQSAVRPSSMTAPMTTKPLTMSWT